MCIRDSYEHDAPGDMIHVDIKKLGKIPPGGGWRVHGRASVNHQAKKTAKIGYSYIHAAVDDHSRLAYAEVHDDEKAVTAVDFWRRAKAFFEAHGITTKRVLTDNGSCYRSGLFNDELAEAGISHKYCRTYRPQTNG